MLSSKSDYPRLNVFKFLKVRGGLGALGIDTGSEIVEPDCNDRNKTNKEESEMMSTVRTTGHIP